MIITMEDYMEAQAEVSADKFGYPTAETDCERITQKIKDELEEVSADPYDLEEWIDVIILALDGYWRHGGEPKHIVSHLVNKLEKIKGRNYKLIENGTFQHES